MTHWYYADAAGQRQGPIDADELRSRHARGELNPHTLVWRDGLADWQPLSSVATELALELPTAQPSDSLAADAFTGADADAALPQAWAAAGGDIVYAGFWRRAAASIIDSFLIGLATLPIVVPLGIAAGVFSIGHEEAGWVASLLLQVVVQGLSLLVTVTYFACFHASRLMASPGKLAVGIKVVRGDGRRLAPGRSIGRGFAYYLSFLTLYIGFLMAAFTQRKQGLHDLICDTVVVDRWAFTDTPQRQQRGLDTVTIVILSLYGLLLLLVMGLLAVALVAGLASGH